MAKVLAHETITVSSVVKGLSPTIYDPPEGIPASYAIIHAENGPMRYLVDGQNPTTLQGALLEDGDIVELPSIYHIKNFKVIKSESDAGKLTVTYEN